MQTAGRPALVPESAAVHYERHRPEQTTLYRLAALVPRPRLHLIRLHGVLAPNATLRAMGVAQEPEPPAQAAPPAECEAFCAHRNCCLDGSHRIVPGA